MIVIRSAEPVDIDRDGDVKIETPSGALHVKASPDVARTLKEGDTALVDVIIVPLRQRCADAL